MQHISADEQRVWTNVIILLRTPPAAYAFGYSAGGPGSFDPTTVKTSKPAAAETIPRTFRETAHEEDAPDLPCNIKPRTLSTPSQLRISTTKRETRWLEDGSWVASDRPTPPFAVIFTGRLDVHDDEALMRAPVAWLLAFHTRVLWRCRCGHLRTA
ncbi:hypothetical protein Q7P36_005684 [Cladosporium allicinum]